MNGTIRKPIPTLTAEDVGGLTVLGASDFETTNLVEIYRAMPANSIFLASASDYTSNADNNLPSAYGMVTILSLGGGRRRMTWNKSSGTPNAQSAEEYIAEFGSGDTACTWREVYTTRNLASIMLAIYPVGAIYISTVATSPASLFGGTWEQIYSRFLLAASSTYSAGSTGGAATHTLTREQLPVVSGDVIAGAGTEGASAGGYGAFRSASGVFTASGERQYAGSIAQGTWPSGAAYERITMSFGGGEAHNNMPPYLAVYMWKRTA